MLTTKKRYLILFSLWALQGGIALVWLFRIPTDSGHYSLPRLIIGGLIFSFILISLYFVKITYSRNWSNFSSNKLSYIFAYILGLIAIFLAPLPIIILHALGESGNFLYLAYAERLSPLVFVIVASGLEWIIWHTFFGDLDFSFIKDILNPLFYILFLFACVTVIVRLTGWGISPNRVGSYGNPPTPLLEWQIALAIFVGTVFVLIESRLKGKRVDKIIFILIYLFTCFLWLSDPLVPAFFATPPRAPNFEPYPYSDALFYSQYAQSALIGNGFLWPNIPTRPLYVAFLTWLHFLVGQNYYHVIALQTVLLAFFPATLYLLGRELGSRPVGLMVAFLATLRDITANHTANFASNISYSKLFFSEIPTAMLLVIFTLLGIRWMKDTKPDWYIMMTGGVLGAAALIRLQSIILLAPLVLLTAFMMWKLHRAEWVRGIILIVLGLVLMLVPWLTRNYYASGGLVIDDPYSQSMALARRWSGDPGVTFFPKHSNETIAQYSDRMSTIAFTNLKREPGRILGGAANHFFNSLIDSLYILPVRDKLKSPSELLWPEHAFWQVGVRAPILTFLYAMLLALGLATAWRSYRWIGLLPFGFSISYNAWTALFWSSSDRFLIPIDWAWIFYYCLGMLVIVKFALSGLRDMTWISEEIDIENRLHTSFSWTQTILSSVIILCIGTLLPLSELVFPKKYPTQTREQLKAAINLPIAETEIITYGRAIYPRYYESGDGEPGSSKLGYGESDEARLVFFMVGPDPGLVIVPLDSMPEFFPNASDVWVVGEPNGGSMRARFVKVEKNGKSSVYYAP